MSPQAVLIRLSCGKVFLGVVCLRLSGNCHRLLSPQFNYAIETRVQRHINNKANTQAAAAAFGGHQGDHHHTPPRHCPSLRSVLVGAAGGDLVLSQPRRHYVIVCTHASPSRLQNV